MKIPFKNLSLYLDTTNFKRGKPTILFIHGFSGSSSDWADILTQIDYNFSTVAIDLIGHGESSSPSEIKFYESESVVDQIQTVIYKLNIDRIILAGYSMGGRAALSFASKHPELVHGLILESSTAGLQETAEIEERIQSDEKIANKIIAEGVEQFVDFWLNLPIFNSQRMLPAEKLDEIKKQKLKNNPVGLANSLRGFSTGRMPGLWNQLVNLDFPIALLTGELDEKYCTVNRKMSKLLPNAEFHIVEDAGHNIHLEKPSEFVILVNRFLRTNFT